MTMYNRRAFTLLEAIAILPFIMIFLGMLLWMTITQLRITRAAASQAHRQDTMHRVLSELRRDALNAEQLRFYGRSSVTAAEANGEIERNGSIEGLPTCADNFRRKTVLRMSFRCADEVVDYFLIQDDEIEAALNTSDESIDEVDRDEMTDTDSSNSTALNDGETQDDFAPIEDANPNNKKSLEAASAKKATERSNKIVRQYLVRRSDRDELSVRVWSLRDLHVAFAESNATVGGQLLRLAFVGTHHVDARVPAQNRYETTLLIQGSLP